MSHSIPTREHDPSPIGTAWDCLGCVPFHPTKRAQSKSNWAIPMGLGDGMDSWDHALWVGWDGTVYGSYALQCALSLVSLVLGKSFWWGVHPYITSFCTFWQSAFYIFLARIIWRQSTDLESRNQLLPR